MRFTRVTISNRPNKKGIQYMSAQIYLSYTYLIGWSKQDLWYYGVRWTQKRETEFDIGIHYFTSSNPVKEMRNLYGEPDVIHIDKTFTCEKEAQKYEKKVLKEHNIRNSNHWLNKGITGYPNVKGRKQSKIHIKKRIKKIEKQIIIDGIVYSSRAEAARKLKINKTTIYRWIKNGRKKRGENYKKETIINGIVYKSRKEAAEKLNVTTKTIREWIKKEEKF